MESGIKEVHIDGLEENIKNHSTAYKLLTNKNNILALKKLLEARVKFFTSVGNEREKASQEKWWKGIFSHIRKT